MRILTVIRSSQKAEFMKREIALIRYFTSLFLIGFQLY